MYLIDYDNMVKTCLDATQVTILKKAFCNGKIVDIWGEQLEWDDCIDIAGDLCVDEDAYDCCLGEIR